MRKTAIAIFLALTVVLTIAGSAFAASPKPGTDFNGPHFNLNLIGKAKVMPGDYDNPDRHTMFVPLDSTDMVFDINTPNNLNQDNMTGFKINMTQGTEFAMIDGNATDGQGSFQLGAGRYWVYIAVKAKSPKFENAYTDITGWVEAYDNLGALWYYIPVGTVSVSKNGKWTDATDLFFVNTTEDTFDFISGSETNYVPDLGVWVFDYMNGLDTWYEDSGQLAPYDFSSLAYFWQVDNYGNKLIQVRFYPMQ